MPWRLILEEFGPELRYTKDENNVLVDAIYCFDMSDHQDNLNLYKLYDYVDEDFPNSAYPICYQDIAKAQKTDAKLKQKLVLHKKNTLDTFHGGDQNHRLIFRNGKMCLPAALQKKTVDWYHEMICHLVETRIEHNLRQHFNWKGLHKRVHDVCKKCPTC